MAALPSAVESDVELRVVTAQVSKGVRRILVRGSVPLIPPEAKKILQI